MGKDPHDLKEGDKVSWKWGSGQPEGKVMEVNDGETVAISKRGNEIKKNGNEDNPAVKIKADTGSEAVKLASELNGVDGKK